MLKHTDPELTEAFMRWGVDTELYHTGGGCMVLQIPLGQGRVAWLTRDEDDWLLGFYDFGPFFNIDDEGVCVIVWIQKDRKNDPDWIAKSVAGILRRVGVASYPLPEGGL